MLKGPSRKKDNFSGDMHNILWMTDPDRGFSALEIKSTLRHPLPCLTRCYLINVILSGRPLIWGCTHRITKIFVFIRYHVHHCILSILSILIICQYGGTNQKTIMNCSRSVVTCFYLYLPNFTAQHFGTTQYNIFILLSVMYTEKFHQYKATKVCIDTELHRES